MNTSQKIAFLKTMVESLPIDDNKIEKKILDTMLDILNDLCIDQRKLSDSIDRQEERADSLYGELMDLLDDDWDDDDDDDDDEDDDDDDEDEDWDDDDDEDDEDWDDGDEDDEDGDDKDDPFYEVTCPHCGENLLVDGDSLPKSHFFCPVCNTEIKLDKIKKKDTKPDTGKGKKGSKK